MYRVRTVKTVSGAILLHVGSAKNEEELLILKESALNWIERNSQQKFLFPLVKSEPKSSLISLDKCEYLGFRYQLLYDVLWSLSVSFKFHLLPNSKILNDLVIARIASPSSKVEAFEFIFDYFGITHSRRDFYRTLSELPKLKDEVEARIISVARKHFNFPT